MYNCQYLSQRRVTFLLLRFKQVLRLCFITCYVICIVQEKFYALRARAIPKTDSLIPFPEDFLISPAEYTIGVSFLAG